MEDIAEIYLNDVADHEIGIGPAAEELEAHGQLLREFKRRALLQAYRINMEALMPSMEEFEEDAQDTGEDPEELWRRYRNDLIPHMTSIAEGIAVEPVTEPELILFARQELGERISDDEMLEVFVSLVLHPAFLPSCS
jgi:hypothetical protein